MDGEQLREELAADPDGPLHLDCIESPIYADVRSMANIKLAELLAEIQSGDFNGGDLTIKIFDMQTAAQEITVQDEGGEAADSARYYRNPTFEYAIAATLKKTAKDKGRYSEKRQFEMCDGRFLAAPVPSPQMTMDEITRKGK